MQTLLQRNFSQNPISVATYCPFIDWHSSGGNTIATLKDACVSTKHQTSAPLAFLVTLTATQRDSRTITWNRGNAFLSHFSCPGRKWGLHPWMAYYCSMTDILQYIYISFINPRAWYWCSTGTIHPPTADYILWPPSAAVHRLHAIRVLLAFKQPGHFGRQ